MWSGNDRKQLWIFGVPTLGVALLLLLPAFAAVVCNGAVKGAEPIPKRFYAFFLLIVLVFLVFSFLGKGVPV